MLLDVSSPSFWTSRAGREERIETVSRLVSGEVRAVRLDAPILAKYGYDHKTCRFISEWWPEGRGKETIRESIRCYTPMAFVGLLVGTGLVADIFEVGCKPFDPKDLSGDSAVLLAGNRSYRVRLKLDGKPA